MHVILLALGLIMALAGLALVGFGIAAAAGTVGNMLIVVGMIAIVGGLILIGLASAIGQLRRIEQVLAVRPLPRALGPEPAAVAPDVRGPFVAPLPAAQARFEPGREVPAPLPEPAIEMPHQTGRDQVSSPQPRREEISQPATSERLAEKPPRRPEAPPVQEPIAERNFAAVWSRESAADAPRDADAERISAIETEPADEGEASWAPAVVDAVQIFKSGVIDGMAYTLYTDGSIEAELAQGTVKFSSIDELRAYLVARE
jgi:hypothetical protein